MKYTRTFRTYDRSSLTSSGWLVESNDTRARLTYRTCWQGSRSGTVVTCRLDAPLETEADAAALAEKLAELFGTCALENKRGSNYGRFRVQSTGYTIR